MKRVTKHNDFKGLTNNYFSQLKKAKSFYDTPVQKPLTICKFLQKTFYELQISEKLIGVKISFYSI